MPAVRSNFGAAVFLKFIDSCGETILKTKAQGENLMEKVIFFLDFANINRVASDKGIDIDYEDLLNYISEGRFLIDAHCYVPIDPRNEHRLDRKLEQLWRSRYIVTTKVGSVAGDTYKCNFDVEITMDILRIAYQAKPDIIVLGSGDSDFVPLVEELRKSGIRVEVASFENAATRNMILKSSGFISLDYYLQERSNNSHEVIQEETTSQTIENGVPDYQAILAQSQQLDDEGTGPTDNTLQDQEQLPDDDEPTAISAEPSKARRRTRRKVDGN
jgi:uncharacterized LabA/DUF88 family protein